MGRVSLAVILLFGLCAGLASRHIAFDDDEFQHAHMAWLVARGEVPHRDFFEHHLPLYHLALAPFTLGTPGPERILTLRFLSVLMAMGTLGCLAGTMKQWTGDVPPGVLVLVAFSPIFFVKMVEVRPEGFCLLLACATSACLKNPKHLLLSGLMCGAMVMGSQKFIFLAAGLFLLAWMEHGGRNLLRFCLGGIIFPAGIGLYYLATGSLVRAFQDLVILNINWKESFSPAMYASLFWTGSSVLIVSGVLGAFTSAERSTKRAVLILNLSGLAAVLLVPIPFRQTFLMLYPGLALGAAGCWREGSFLFQKRKSKIAGGFCFSLLALLPALTHLKQEMKETSQGDLTLMREMDERSSAPVFDGRGLLFYRDHIGFYPWMHQGLMHMLDPEEHASRTISALRTTGFPDILWDYRVDVMSPDLHRFLQTHYVPVSPEPLWVPGSKMDRSALRTGTEVALPVKGTYLLTWQGGSVLLNGMEISSGQLLELGTDPLRIRGTGFIRDFTITRQGGAK